jgi:sugar phosphate isomerase/epimerase
LTTTVLQTRGGSRQRLSECPSPGTRLEDANVKSSEPTSRRAFLRVAFTTAACCAGALPGRAWSDDGSAPRAAEKGWLIGCYTRPWDKHEYRIALDAIGEAGFRYAGLMTQSSKQGNLVISEKTTPEEAFRVGEEAKKRGLKIPSVYGGGFPVAKSLQAGIDGLKRLIDNCVAAQAGSLMVGGTGSAKLFDDYYKAVAEVCDYAAEKKVALVVKPHGGLNATGPQCRKIVERVGHKNFTLWYDAANIFYYSDGKVNPVEDVRTVEGLVTGFCVKDFHMAAEGGKVSKEVMLTPGTGRVDFPAVMAGLKKGGFTSGPLMIECLSRGDLPFLLKEAKKAKRFVENLVA